MPQLPHLSEVQFQRTFTVGSQRVRTGLSLSCPLPRASFCWLSFFVSFTFKHTTWTHINPHLLHLLTYYTNKLTLIPKIPEQSENSSWIHNFCSKYILTCDLHWYFLFKAVWYHNIIKKNTSLLKARRKKPTIPKSYQLDVTIFHMLMNIDRCTHIYVYKIKLHNNLFA